MWCACVLVCSMHSMPVQQDLHSCSTSCYCKRVHSLIKAAEFRLQLQHHLRPDGKITCVQGSAIADQLSNKRQEVVEDQRQLIKTQIRVGWSAEAVKQGITHAKKGDNDSAISCYKKVRFTICCLAVLHHASRICMQTAYQLAIKLLLVCGPTKAVVLDSDSAFSAGFRPEQAQCGCLGGTWRSICQSACLPKSRIRPSDSSRQGLYKTPPVFAVPARLPT